MTDQIHNRHLLENLGNKDERKKFATQLKKSEFNFKNRHRGEHVAAQL